MIIAGVSEWSKEAGLGPAAVGLRGFDPHPPHQKLKPSALRRHVTPAHIT